MGPNGTYLENLQVLITRKSSDSSLSLEKRHIFILFFGPTPIFSRNIEHNVILREKINFHNLDIVWEF